MFRDPIRRYAERLAAAGVPTHAHEFAGMFHVFQILMPWTDQSHESFAHLRGLRAEAGGRRAPAFGADRPARHPGRPACLYGGLAPPASPGSGDSGGPHNWNPPFRFC